MLKLLNEETIKVVPTETADEKEDTEEVSDVEITEDPVEEQPQVSEEIVSQACADAVHNLITDMWDSISNVNSLATTIDYDYTKEEDKTDIKNILNTIVDDLTVNIGMLHKISEIITEKTSKLLADGENKAEKIIEEN